MIRKWTSAIASLLVVLSSIGVQAGEKDIVSTAVNAGSFNTLVAAVKAADLATALQSKGPFTVFAPTDEAFAKLPAGTVEALLKPENKAKLVAVLKYHVVSGKVLAADVVKLTGATTLNGQRVDIRVSDAGVGVDGANVVKTDIGCSNGVIHVIDSVILPAEESIPEVASKAGTFNTLIAAAKAAGLVGALSGGGPLTVFAPTDEAFKKLPAGTVATLLKPENKQQLVDILTYHVVPGRVYSTDAVSAGSAKTLQGGDVTISVRNGVAMVNSAKLLATDIDASNGVIHVIDSVILPQTDGQVANPAHMIETAIAKGAPLYNSGHKEACATLYMSTIKKMLATPNHGMSASMTQTLHTAVNSASSCSCVDTKAWTLRRAMDAAYVSLR